MLKKSFCYEPEVRDRIFFLFCMCVERKMGKIRDLNPLIRLLSDSTKSVKHTVKLNLKFQDHSREIRSSN